MAYTIKKYHGSYNRTKKTGSYKYIVVHYTSTNASALNNCKYFAGGNRNASAHYFIDSDSIYEYLDPSQYYSWAVGDGAGKYGITNSNSINIEVCRDNNAFTSGEINRLAWLVDYLMDKYGIKSSNVVRHYDASRKSCPAYYVSSSRWKSLKSKITSGAGTWKKNATGWWWEYADGSYPKSEWEQINGKWYYFNSSGYMVTGWRKVSGTWYYMDSSGAMKTGWIKLSGKWYYLNSSGAMQTGWEKVNGKWYYLNSDGAMATGWKKVSGKWYYLHTTNGNMYSSTILKIDGKWYAFGDSGAMKTGSIKIDSSGAIQL